MEKTEIKQTFFYLSEYNEKGIKNFLGLKNGILVREKSKFDQIEADNDKIIFVVPKDIRHISVSYLEGLICNVVRKLGKEKFLEKYYFLNEGSYDFEKPLNKAIRYILKQ